MQNFHIRIIITALDVDDDKIIISRRVSAASGVDAYHVFSDTLHELPAAEEPAPDAS